MKTFTGGSIEWVGILSKPMGKTTKKFALYGD